MINREVHRLSPYTLLPLLLWRASDTWARVLAMTGDAASMARQGAEMSRPENNKQCGVIVDLN